MLVNLKQINNSEGRIFVSFSSEGRIILFRKTIGSWQRAGGQDYMAHVGEKTFHARTKKQLMTDVCSNSVLMTYFRHS